MRTAPVLLVLLLLTACQPAQEEVRIGGLFALTGYGAQWGEAERNAVALAIEEANAAGGVDGTAIVFIAEDTQTDPTATVTALSKLTNVDGVQYVIGPTWESSASAIAPAAVQQGIVLITPSAYKSFQDQHATTLFSTYPPYEYEIRAMKGFFAEQGLDTFAIVHDGEFFSETMATLFQEEAGKNGWTVAATYKHESGGHDYRTTLLRIQETGGIDAIYTPLADDNDHGVLMRQMKEIGLDLPVVSTSSTENAQLLATQGEAIEGIIYPFPIDAQGYAPFAERYEARFGSAPGSPSASTAYDATNLLIAALRSGARTPADVATYLHALDSYDGASNTITFDEDGIIGDKAQVVKSVCDGQFKPYAEC